MSFLADTNAISELSKARPHPNVEQWFAAEGTEVYLSVLTIGEIRRGIHRLGQRMPDEATRLEAWLEQIRSLFEMRFVEVDMNVAQTWGRLSAQRTLPVVDSLLAATAIEKDLTLVTRNVRDFEGTGVRLLNPFEPRI